MTDEQAHAEAAGVDTLESGLAQAYTRARNHGWTWWVTARLIREWQTDDDAVRHVAQATWGMLKGKSRDEITYDDVCDFLREMAEAMDRMEERGTTLTEQPYD